MTTSDGPASGQAALPPLSITSVVGGGLEDKAWTRALGDLQLRLDSLGAVGADEFHVMVSFFIPGEVYGPSFSGLRVSSFVEENRTLVVQVALPEHPADDARSELLGLLGRAVDRAENWGRRKGRLTGSLAGVREAATRLAAGP